MTLSHFKKGLYICLILSFGLAFPMEQALAARTRGRQPVKTGTQGPCTRAHCRRPCAPAPHNSLESLVQTIWKEEPPWPAGIPGTAAGASARAA